MLLSSWSFAVIVERTAVMSRPLTYTLSVVAAKPFSTPAHRASSCTWPCSCTTQRTCLAPSLVNRWPAASPAMDSSCPKYISAPVLCQSATPALNSTTGMPLLMAFFSAGPMASGLGSVRRWRPRWG